MDKLTKLATAKHPITWNKLAISLADQEYYDAIPIILNLLRDSKTQGARGSLLYALRQYRKFPDIFKEETTKVVKTLENENYEVRLESEKLLAFLAL